MVSEMHAMLSIFYQPVQRFHDLCDIRASIVRVEIEEKGVDVSGASFDEDHDTRRRICDSASFVRTVAIKPCGQSCNIVIGGQSDSFTADIVEQSEVIEVQFWQVGDKAIVDCRSCVSNMFEQV